MQVTSLLRHLPDIYKHMSVLAVQAVVRLLRSDWNLSVPLLHAEPDACQFSTELSWYFA
jgi:hypothetical protein